MTSRPCGVTACACTVECLSSPTARTFLTESPRSHHGEKPPTIFSIAHESADSLQESICIRLPPHRPVTQFMSREHARLSGDSRRACYCGAFKQMHEVSYPRVLHQNVQRMLSEQVDTRITHLAPGRQLTCRGIKLASVHRLNSPPTWFRHKVNTAVF